VKGASRDGNEGEGQPTFPLWDLVDAIHYPSSVVSAMTPSLNGSRIVHGLADGQAQPQFLTTDLEVLQKLFAFVLRDGETHAKPEEERYRPVREGKKRLHSGDP
jgi:hypothetical protein